MNQPDRTRRKQKIHEANDWICQYCGLDMKNNKSLAQLEHIYPIALGGSNSKDNLTTACKNCNSEKGHKTLEEWRNKILCKQKCYVRAKQLEQLFRSMPEYQHRLGEVERLSKDLYMLVTPHVFYFERKK